MKASDELSSLCCSSGIVGRLGTGSLAGGFLRVVIADCVGSAGSFAAGDCFAGGDVFFVAGDCFAGADVFFATGDCFAGADVFFATGDCFAGADVFFATGDCFAGGGLSSPLLVWVAESASCFFSCFIDTAAGAGGHLGKTVSLK